MKAAAAETGNWSVLPTNLPYQPPTDPALPDGSAAQQRGGFNLVADANSTPVMNPLPPGVVDSSQAKKLSAAELENLGGLEEQLIQAENTEAPDGSTVADLKKKIKAAKGPLTAFANQLSKLMPKKMAVTVTLGLAAGVPGVISGGLTGFARISGSETDHQPLDIGASLGASSFGAWASYVMGNKAIPPKVDPDAPIPSSNGHDETKEGARQGFQAGASILGYAYVNTMNPVLKNQQVGIWIPHLCAFSLSSDGSFGGSISIPIPFAPVLRVPIGIYIEHPWFSIASKPVFKAIHKAEAFGRKYLAPVIERGKKFVGKMRDLYDRHQLNRVRKNAAKTADGRQDQSSPSIDSAAAARLGPRLVAKMA